MSTTTALKDAVYRYRRDSNATPYWYLIQFPKPATVYKYEPNRHHISFTQFYVITQKAKPS